MEEAVSSSLSSRQSRRPKLLIHWSSVCSTAILISQQRSCHGCLPASPLMHCTPCRCWRRWIGTKCRSTQDRAKVEAAALAEEARHCPEHVPALYHFDPTLALTVMQYLPPPHDILRRALVAGRTFPLLSAHVATFLARTLFRTSLLALDSRQYRHAPHLPLPLRACRYGPLWIDCEAPAYLINKCCLLPCAALTEPPVEPCSPDVCKHPVRIVQ